MSDIHTLGDSHAAFTFRGEREGGLEYIYYQGEDAILKVPLFVHFVGSQTMYSFGKRGCKKKYFEGISAGSYLVFCFGEIDVRCHIYDQVHNEKRDLEEVLDQLVKAYVGRVLAIKNDYLIHPIIFGITPPVRNLTVDGYPSVGPFKERVQYTKLLNLKLKERAAALNILYFDVCKEYSLEDGTLDMSLSDGLMHIGQNFNTLAKQKLCNLITAQVKTH